MTPHDSQRLYSRAYIIAALAILGLWGLFAFVALPQLTRSAYEGTSIEALNRVISGRDVHPVEYYMSQARRLGLLGLLGLLLAVVGGPFAWWFRAYPARAWAAVVRSEPRGSALGLAAVAGWAGLMFGATEATAVWIRFRMAGYLGNNNNPDALWMAPLALGLFMALLALIVYVVLDGRRRGLGVGFVVGLCAMLGAYSLVRSLRLGISPLASWVLALGIGAQIGRLLSRPGPRRIARRTVLPLAAAAVLVGVVMAASEWRSERRIRMAATAGGPAPDVLLIVWDTTRKQSLSLHGYDRPTTPRLDRRAAEGVVFDHAIATAPWTLPTHASLFTGRSVHEIDASWAVPLDDSDRTLAEAFGERGYATGGFVANFRYTTRITGLDRGFERYDDYHISPTTALLSTQLTQSITSWVWDRLPTDRETPGRKYARDVNDEFLSWVDGLDDRPFFAFLNYFDAHAPYELHEEYLESLTAVDPAPDVYIGRGRYEAPSQEQLRWIDAYDTSITYMDEAVDDLLAALGARGRLERTIVIVTSDHGEQLGERGLDSHGTSLYSQVLAVPLVFLLPQGGPSGLRVDTPVSLSEVPETVARLAGLEGASFPGRSLERFWKEPDPGPGAPVLSRLRLSPFGERPPTAPILRGDMMSLVLGTLHYIANGDGSEEVYDLASDPEETLDLAAADPPYAELPRLREALRRVVAERGSRVATGSGAGSDRH